ncbi:MAG: anhydro-N-acetylmuramic acid kinase [Bacteroidia bacterium]|nr:anhydro-N-acetylmuramic acid kinase [Bacteroidia bacterium]
MKTLNKYKVIGLMSGTSLDGLDIVYCKIRRAKKTWKFEIQTATTIKYNQDWKRKLSSAHTLSATELFSLDHAYGKYLAKAVVDFNKKHKIKHIDFVASHGHTIFHQPENGFTYQLGSGQILSDVSGIPVVFDFRSLDVIRGGQGAPLVPIGDHYLFGDYDICLNLGGIANLSMVHKGQRIAFDFCFANMGLNYLAGKSGKEYDKNGEVAATGAIDKVMLKNLEGVYKPFRKNRSSLGREGFEKLIQPILENDTIPLKNRLRTFCESIAIEITNAVPSKKKKVKLLATGGGVLNSFLVQLIEEKMLGKAELIIPDRQIIEFKEAVVFALLGVLRIRGEVNCLKSVTGASEDSSCGVLAGF